MCGYLGAAGAVFRRRGLRHPDPGPLLLARRAPSFDSPAGCRADSPRPGFAGYRAVPSTKPGPPRQPDPPACLPSSKSRPRRRYQPERGPGRPARQPGSADRLLDGLGQSLSRLYGQVEGLEARASAQGRQAACWNGWPGGVWAEQTLPGDKPGGSRPRSRGAGPPDSDPAGPRAAAAGPGPGVERAWPADRHAVPVRAAAQRRFAGGRAG